VGKVLRSVQHKPSRDTKNVKELQELKSENKALKRQVSRLQKVIDKLMGKVIENDVEADIVDETGTIPTVETESSKDLCENCGSPELAKVNIPSGQLIACRACSHRRVEK
jgi:DNA-directed RNA polymerase subunit RPC12/RpoP